MPLLTFLYGARGQELACTSQAGFSQLSRYTEVGLLAHRSAGILTPLTEQQLTQLHQQQHPQLIGTEITCRWHYNLAHQLIGIEDPEVTNEWYRLNANQQITEIKRSGVLSSQESFIYDANLNLIAQHIQSTAIAGQNTGSTKIQNIQLTGGTIRNGDNWFKYDNQGRLIEKRVVENGFRQCTYFYYWNALNQLVRYSTSQGDERHYQYNAFGRRIRKLQVIHNGQQVENRPWPSPLSQPKSQPKIGCEYYYLGDQLIEEAPIYADGTVAFEHSTHWLYAPNQLTPTARYQQGELNYVITDQVGTPTELLAEDGTGRWRVKHNLWGSILKQYSANDDDYCNLRFPGQYADSESGLHYNRYRYYDPNIAQYLTPDPIDLAGGFNPYGYVHKPTGWVDPFEVACCPKVTRGKSGEPLSAEISIGPNDLGTGTGTNQSSREFARGLGNDSDDAGHILGRALGGQGGIENVFPQLANINRGRYRVFESEVVKYIKANGNVDIKWQFIYVNGATRPTQIHYNV